jgi:hypothetical protein
VGLSPLLTFERTGRFVRNSVGDHAIEGDLDAIILMLQLQRFQNGDVQISEVDEKFEPVNAGP